MQAHRHSRWPILASCALLALAGCDEVGLQSSLTPQVRPASLRTAPLPEVPSAPRRTAQSYELERYYTQIQNDLLTHGLLRTDGGGPDTPYSADDLTRNFEKIVFFDEFSSSAGLSGASRNQQVNLSRWNSPVRIAAEFGATVPQDRRTRDAAAAKNYAQRLARITGHPISTVDREPNFHVLITGKDDSAFLRTRLRQIVPHMSETELDLFSDLPRSYYCLVIGISDAKAPNVYTNAIALIRAEHPDLVRLSCIHEEIAQGLGLPNDSPSARPSIFNDDDEFALLTSHDELLLKMLYDQRLTPGMSADEARPTIHIIARELMGQTL